ISETLPAELRQRRKLIGRAQAMRQIHFPPEETPLSLYDQALPYDPTMKADPTNLEDPLEDRDIGGLGIMLVRQSVDEWRYAHDGNRNCNHFVLKRS
ncbi:MAG: ATP-binding protein, partial [Chloroflexota bacterium]